MRRVKQWKGVMFHHAAYNWSPATSIDQVVEDITEWHRKRRFAMCGYHAVVRGEEYRLVRPAWYSGSHCRGHNSRFLGICVARDFRTVAITNEDIVSCILAVKDMDESVEIKRMGYHPRIMFVEHRDYGNTMCPVINIADRVRKRMYGVNSAYEY